MKTYKEVLEIVRKKNPELTFREAQIEASKIYKEQKDLEIPDVKDDDPPKAMVFNGSLDPDVVEAKIREAGVNIHNIQEIAKNFSPDFTLVKGEKKGPNREVWLEGPVKVPRVGNFLVFMI